MGCLRGLQIGVTKVNSPTAAGWAAISSFVNPMCRIGSEANERIEKGLTYDERQTTQTSAWQEHLLLQGPAEQ